MKAFITKCDFLGFQPSVHVNGERGFNTFFTGLLSIFLGIVAILTTLYFGSDLVFKSSSTVIQTSDSITSFGPYNFSNLDYHVMFAIEDQNFQYYVDPTVFYVSGAMTMIKNVPSNKTSEITQEFSVIPVNVDLCSKYYKDSDIVEKNMVFPLDKYYCPDPNKATMLGYWGSDTYISFRISFNKCINTTENNSHCKPEEEIENAVQGAYIAYEMTSYKVDQRNFKNPLQRIFADNYNIINSKLSLEYAIGYRPFAIHSNDGLVLNDEYVHEGLDYQEKIFYKLNDGSESFVSFTFEGTAITNIYYRSYTKLQTVVPQIGGFVKAVTMVASIISTLSPKIIISFIISVAFFPMGT